MLKVMIVDNESAIRKGLVVPVNKSGHEKYYF